ncbi:hypothetical protein PLICRDRAFT_180382 [Plicaturopsis crispa FD-325 SS-3]|uniref:Uncharacterized protein n=1 Tax=Plicaturopsis crispa FD-325 SS-3 TaxID=944288 RepID=A0A0C9T5U4_PLICR|nr:hypothetical protein PLICRDRAFT_180382 [Plicaturopsis crispa FD-325 SS-3]
MENIMLEYTRPNDPEIKFSDAICMARVGKLIITTPNADYIPHLSFTPLKVQLRKDGRFGDKDYTTGPQRFHLNFAHSAVIRRRRDQEKTPWQIFWNTPKLNQFRPAKGSAFGGLGFCSSKLIDLVEPVVTILLCDIASYQNRAEVRFDYTLAGYATNLRQAMLRLKHNPYKFLDLVNDFAYLSRCALNSDAYLRQPLL